MTPTNAPIGATVLGYPRIGRQRELKRALESYWAGRTGIASLTQVAQSVRLESLATMAEAGLDSVPVNTFSHYDQMLDTTVMVGAVPDRFAAIGGIDSLDGFDAYRYFAMARGTSTVVPLEMTKWFDTNYHYLVPEVGPETAFVADAAKPIAEFTEATKRGLNARPVLVGPFTYLALAKATPGADGFAPLRRLDDLTETYLEILQALQTAGVQWVQLDEPAITRQLTEPEVAALQGCYSRLAGSALRPALFVATYFAKATEALPALAATSIEAIGLDLTRGAVPSDLPRYGRSDQQLVLGAVDGRNIWRSDLTEILARLDGWRDLGSALAISSSCSLLHVPYDASVETELPRALRANLAFADQKLAEVVALQGAFSGGRASAAAAFAAAEQAIAVRKDIPGLVNRKVQERLVQLRPEDRLRTDRVEREPIQNARLKLPMLPTTTIGSFPQTAEVRRARADRRVGRIGEAGYVEDMRAEIRRVIELQEQLGLDVLVHGEPERNDMVQYFAEQLDGYATTAQGWVQSYGSRCVRPPILYGDVARRHALTVPWTAYAASLTKRPVKGMLTGPVTMLAWSFVREDQARPVTADQVALALREEVTDLEEVGVPIIQVDEPALRELLPLRPEAQGDYLSWAVNSFRLATAGARDETQIHTHLCYSEFGEIIDAIDRLDADVTSIEAARSHMGLLADITDRGFSGALGPGVYDIHSPRVPTTAEMAHLLRKALESMPRQSLWVNPDCGLKTRSYSEAARSLAHLVEAAHLVRSELAR